jgi:hypothetical protein
MKKHNAWGEGEQSVVLAHACRKEEMNQHDEAPIAKSKSMKFEEKRAWQRNFGINFKNITV